MMLSAAINTFLVGIKSPDSRASYSSTLAKFAELYGHMDCNSVMPGDIRAYLDGLTVSDSTRHLRYMHLQSFFNFVSREEKIRGISVQRDNPCHILRGYYPRPKRAPMPVSDTISEDMAALRQSLRYKYRLIYDLGVIGGLRIGEILRLTPGDIRCNHRWSFVLLRSTKNGDQNVQAPITLELCEMLKKYIEKKSIGPDDPVFDLTKQAVWATLKKRGIEPHDLRRYAAFRAMESGKDLETIRAFLRHSSVAITERYIGQISPEKLAEKMGMTESGVQ